VAKPPRQTGPPPKRNVTEIVTKVNIVADLATYSRLSCRKLTIYVPKHIIICSLFVP
jgi:hypothetical protein